MVEFWLTSPIPFILSNITDAFIFPYFLFLSLMHLFPVKLASRLCHLCLAEARFSQLFSSGLFAFVFFSVHSYDHLNLSFPFFLSIIRSPGDYTLFFFYCNWGPNSTYQQIIRLLNIKQANSFKWIWSSLNRIGPGYDRFYSVRSSVS